MPRLTKRFVDSVKPDPTGKDVTHWDDSLKGFGLRIQGGGSASWVVMYRTGEGRLRKLTLAKVGTLTPDEARTLAREKLGEVAKGADPSAERKAARTAQTVSEVCDWYLGEAESGSLLGRGGRRIKASTLAMDKSRIETHVKPLIGRRTVNSLVQADIERLQADIIAGKSAKGRKDKGRGGQATGGAGVAPRVVGMLRTIFEAAHRRKMVKHNPAVGVKKQAGKKHKRFLTLDEIAALGKAMRELGGIENRTGIAAIRALLLTGCRRMEILALPWSWLDAKGRCIRFGDSKSGAQLRAIGAGAVKVFDAQPQSADCPWVFPADLGDGHFVGLPRVLARLCQKAELADVTVHTLRHSFAATAAEMGYSELTIAGLLGHTVPGVTARYAHVPDRALISAADSVSTRIAMALDGEIEAEEFPPEGQE